MSAVLSWVWPSSAGLWRVRASASRNSPSTYSYRVFLKEKMQLLTPYVEYYQSPAIAYFNSHDPSFQVVLQWLESMLLFLIQKEEVDIWWRALQVGPAKYCWDNFCGLKQPSGPFCCDLQSLQNRDITILELKGLSLEIGWFTTPQREWSPVWRESWSPALRSGCQHGWVWVHVNLQAVILLQST